jgi:hypothetical protein
VWRVTIRGPGNIRWDWTFTTERKALNYARSMMQRGFAETKNGGNQVRFHKVHEVIVDKLE